MALEVAADGEFQWLWYTIVPAVDRVADGVHRLKHRQAGFLLAVADAPAAKRVGTPMNSDAAGLDREDRQSYQPSAGPGVAGS